MAPSPEVADIFPGGGRARTRRLPRRLSPTTTTPGAIAEEPLIAKPLALLPVSSGEAVCQPTNSRKVVFSMPSTSSGESVDHYPPGKLSTDPVSSGEAVYRVPPTTSSKQAGLSRSPPGRLSADPVSSGEAVCHVLSATPGEIVNQSPPGKLLTNKSRSPSPSSC